MAAYQQLYSTGELKARAEKAKSILEECRLCPRRCGTNRLAGESGKCHITSRVMVSSYGPHFGEEAPLVGRRGSGTIFFTYCNLRCVFCQNYTISQLGEGTEVGREELARMMLSLQSKSCHNINLVSPTHVVPYILDALELAVSMGLYLPLVYNSGGYDSVETLELLDGIVDIYMPDMKYSDEKTAEQLSGIKDYPKLNRAAIREMHRQVGDLQIDDEGVAQRGLLVRHLVLPNRLAGTQEVVRFLAREVSTNTYLNVMAQYHPCHKAFDIPLLARPVSGQEFSEAIDLARRQGLNRLDRYNFSLPLRFVLR
ncbi:MAG: radical SAM protein [Chloroflexi bacterium]|nr:radical SAM protein [Chloroflexota bacterium]